MRRFPSSRALLSVAGALLIAGTLILMVSGGVIGGPAADTADETPGATGVAFARDPEVPDLPFEDNPDPNQCGIPVQWGSDGQAWLSGLYGGELIQPTVFLYDSHLRQSVTGSAAHGSEVQVVLFQENPVLDYYFVRVDGRQEGWVPAPFLSFDPVTGQTAG